MKVEDFERWKSVYDADTLDRRANGSKGGLLLQDANAPNEIVLLLEWDDAKLAQLKELANSPKMKEVQEKSGYTAPPEVHVLKVAERPSK
jgi:hypothetical protein